LRSSYSPEVFFYNLQIVFQCEKLNLWIKTPSNILLMFYGKAQLLGQGEMSA